MNNGDGLFCSVVVVAVLFLPRHHCLSFYRFSLSLPLPAVAHSFLCVLIHPFLQQPNATREKKREKIFEFSFLSTVDQILNHIGKISGLYHCYQQVFSLIDRIQ